MQALSSLLHDQRRVKDFRIGEIKLSRGFFTFNFTHPTVMNLLQSLQDVSIGADYLFDDDSVLQE